MLNELSTLETQRDCSGGDAQRIGRRGEEEGMEERKRVEKGSDLYFTIF